MCLQEQGYAQLTPRQRLLLLRALQELALCSEVVLQYAGIQVGVVQGGGRGVRGGAGAVAGPTSHASSWARASSQSS